MPQRVRHKGGRLRFLDQNVMCYVRSWQYKTISCEVGRKCLMSSEAASMCGIQHLRKSRVFLICEVQQVEFEYVMRRGGLLEEYLCDAVYSPQ